MDKFDVGLRRGGRGVASLTPALTWVATLGVVALVPFAGALAAVEPLLEKHCAECHNEDKAKGKFELSFLGDEPGEGNVDYWLDALDLVIAEEMPPEDDSHLNAAERSKIAAFLETKLRDFGAGSQSLSTSPPRRLNNREFANSVRDVLMIEDVGTHQPTDNLIGDSLYHGFDSHAESLGFSRFHLEQYIEAVRKIVDATILSGEQPVSKRYEISADKILRANLKQNGGKNIQRGKNGVFDFLDPRLYGYFEDFTTAPATGRYRIKIRCTGKDRHVYDSAYTGFYDGDPIQLSVHLGNRVQTFDLPDEKLFEIELDEWIAAGTRLKMFNPTDAFRERGNSNFKFQYAIAADHLKEHDPERYAAHINQVKKARRYNGGPDRWPWWVTQWEGARPQVFSAEIEGPFYESWPPKRQVALIGQNPSIDKAAEILRPIAERAWRRPVRDGELDEIVALVTAKADTLDDVQALKEGIVAILVSPAFLLLNTEDLSSGECFASKLSYFLQSTLPNERLRNAVKNGELHTFAAIRDELSGWIRSDQVAEFLREFPRAWLELDDINFMAPDPEQYPFYHKKRVSEDMIAEVLAFFRYAVEENLPLPEFLSADYSFINADLARVYGLEGVAQDSQLRKYTFTDGRRGGLLGMGAFLTSTADSLATSPIHRAVYVMENFMGIHPTPPPPDVVIKEPDVRSAKTIKEVLSAHVADKNCASCHEAIDPWGYAFENFDPTGAWRDGYVVPEKLEIDDDGNPIPKRKETAREKRIRLRNPQLAKEVPVIAIDASARFRNGMAYQDIEEFRKQVLSDVNRDRFVRCFISKLLTYANGVEPAGTDLLQVDKILAVSAGQDYRIVETIAAVIDSPLFRGGVRE